MCSIIDSALAHPAAFGLPVARANFCSERVHPAAMQMLTYLVEVQHYKLFDESWNYPGDLKIIQVDYGYLEGLDQDSGAMAIKIMSSSLEPNDQDLLQSLPTRIGLDSLDSTKLENTLCLVKPKKVHQNDQYRALYAGETIQTELLALKVFKKAIPQLLKDVPFEEVSISGVERYFLLRSSIIQGQTDKNLLNKRFPAEVNNKITEKTMIVRFKKGQFKLEEANTIVIPTDEGLHLLTQHYLTKYGVAIQITPIKSAPQILLSTKSQTWGMILTHEGEAHVIPILCLKVASGMIQAANLDLRVAKDARKWAPPVLENVEWIEVEGGRQADPWSCRTDALVILKDALRQLHTNKISDLHQLLPGTLAPLPIPWSKTVQVTKSIRGDQNESVVSKKEMSLKLFRERFTQQTIEASRWSIYSKDDYGNQIWTDINITTPLNLNMYLNYKGKRNISLVRKMISKK